MTSTGPFSARFFLLAVFVFHFAWYLFEESLEMRQQRKPLPPEVSGIYDSERYDKFISRKREIRTLCFIYRTVNLAIETCILFSPVFSAIEQAAGGNVYLVVLLTHMVYWLAGAITDLPYSYYYSLVINEKYGLNKLTRKEFFKDELLSTVGTAVSGFALTLLLAFCGEHMVKWTNGFTVGWRKTVLIGLGVYGALTIFVLGTSLLHYFLLKKRYTFTPLPEGALRDRIKELLVGCRKKVSQINVYDESKKSTNKNAFLLKLLWHREFGIADNFVNENDARELLAVLSHEIGHLKHRRNLLDLIDRLIGLAVTAVLLALLCYPAPAFRVNEWIRDSFQITQNNYYILLVIYGNFLAPITFVTKRFSNYKSRRNEYEADMEAVKNGFGEELISTFSRITSDELVDLNPHPLLERLNYDHPGMYRRITYIRDAIARTEAESRTAEQKTPLSAPTDQQA